MDFEKKLPYKCEPLVIREEKFLRINAENYRDFNFINNEVEVLCFELNEYDLLDDTFKFLNLSLFPNLSGFIFKISTLANEKDNILTFINSEFILTQVLRPYFFIQI